MRKLIILLLLMFVTTQAEAGLLSQNRFVSGNDVTIADMDGNVSNLLTWANGAVEGGINVKEGSLVSEDFAASASPITRWDEAFGDFTFTGMLPATSTAPDLKSDISAGTSYVDGFRIVKDAVETSYTATKDTFVYIDNGGTYNLCPETVGTESCTSVPPNSLLLAMVTTDDDNITAVTDKRTTAVSLALASSNFPVDYRSRAYVSRDTNQIAHAVPGNLAIGTTIYGRTTNSTKRNLSTGTHWIDGSIVTPSSKTAGLIFVYAYNDSGSSWDIKYSEITPDLVDVADNTDGTLRYHLEGGVYYRAIGWIFQSDDNTYPTYAIGNFSDIGVNNVGQREATGADQSTVATEDQPIQGAKINFYVTGMFVDGTSPTRIGAQFTTAMGDSAQHGSCVLKIDGSNKATSRFSDVGGTCALNYQGVLTQGLHTAEAFYKSGNGGWTANVYGATWNSGILTYEEL